MIDPIATTDLQQGIEEAATLIVGSEYVVALTGAGISVESGVPTFRGPDGIWSKLGQLTTNGYKLFVEDPAAWWKQYVSSAADPTRAQFREAIDKAVPNPGHHALAELEQIDILRATITQNVDGFHTLAGSEVVIEIHGNRHTTSGASAARHAGRERSSSSTASRLDVQSATT